MRFDTPWLALAALLPCVFILIASRRLEPTGRRLLRAAALVGIAALSGAQFRCDRPLRIVAMVDVSPSTRGAAFRDSTYVQQRTSQLAPGRDVRIQFFADGLIDAGVKIAGVETVPVEAAVDRTRLERPDADAILLFSDGRFTSGDTPPIFPVVDSSLDSPGDARITDLRIENDEVAIISNGLLKNRSLQIDGASPSVIPADAISGLTRATRSADVVSATLDAADAWPENDRMSGMADVAEAGEPWLITDSSQLPADLRSYLGPSAIVLPSTVMLGPAQEQNLTAYARALGGTLILQGDPAQFTASLRAIAPHTATPPQPTARWVFLLDASGSMGAADRWARSIDALLAALSRLEPQEDVSVVIFSRESQVITDRSTPMLAMQRVESLRKLAPSGPTGLEAAIASVIASDAKTLTRMVLVTDGDAALPDIAGLIERARAAKIATFLLSIGAAPPNPDLLRLCESTGGKVVAESDAAAWTMTLQKLLNDARGRPAIPVTSGIAVQGVLSGLQFTAREAYPVFVRTGASTLASAGDNPVIASWPVGVGNVVSIAAAIDPSTARAIAERLGDQPTDPRLSISFDETANQVRVRARNDGAPMTSLALTLSRVPTDVSIGKFTQIAPGEYIADLPRMRVPTVAVVTLDGRVVARRAVSARYPAEFDAIGNDLPALEKLAAKSGGRIIMPADVRRIEFARQYHWQPLRPILAAIFSGLLLAAVVMIRAPYLAQRGVRLIKWYAA
ncbi:MAG: VWA domain-containing protein [Burkholderiales bacterium]|nr:VWA domain-containing protein [Phycisphaerae bacterium]